MRFSQHSLSNVCYILYFPSAVTIAKMGPSEETWAYPVFFARHHVCSWDVTITGLTINNDKIPHG